MKTLKFLVHFVDRTQRVYDASGVLKLRTVIGVHLRGVITISPWAFESIIYFPTKNKSYRNLKGFTSLSR